MIPVLVLLFLRAGSLRAWSVTFENPDPCALEGSSVTFRCSYNYKYGQTVTKTAWYKGELKNGTWERVALSDLPSYQNRFQYIGDREHNCSLVLHELQQNDTGYYYFRFDTENYGWRSKKSVFLSITALRARVNPDTVRAGDAVTLECETSCTLNSTVWFKNGRPVTKTKFQAQAEDSGNYSCAVEGHESERSHPVALDVQYPPLNVSVVVSYPSILNESSSINLTCSCSANPAAENFTWFRRTASPSPSTLIQVGSGRVLSLLSVEMSHAYLYLCRARNTVGENNSNEVPITMREESQDLFTLNRIFLLVGVGVKVLILLVLSLVIIWAWRRGSPPAVETEEDGRIYELISTAKMDNRDGVCQREVSV
ncbi:B-cell receptor CD22-like [Cheilinus undulatus]|uniref:B-cell receptor CD22-like n=1 Tax=Cheilinus undulatus TaxID=241271 RepID=UPI001BD2A3E2|nr:B-cell receptor CD22-like [Cheilinus undulatus]